jgi:hypothetical protein
MFTAYGCACLIPENVMVLRKMQAMLLDCVQEMAGGNVRRL